MTEAIHTNDDDPATLYRRHIAMVRRHAQRVVGDAAAAEDVAQEVFIRFLAHRRRGGTEEHVAGFLLSSTTRLALNTLRSRKRRPSHALAEESLHAPEDSMRMLRDILRQSRPAEAEVAACYYLGAMQQEAIATLLGMSRHDVRRRLQAFQERARSAVGVLE